MKAYVCDDAALASTSRYRFMQWGLVHTSIIGLRRQQIMIVVCILGSVHKYILILVWQQKNMIFYALRHFAYIYQNHNTLCSEARCINISWLCLSWICFGDQVMVVLCTEAWCINISWVCFVKLFGSKTTIALCTEAWRINKSWCGRGGKITIVVITKAWCINISWLWCGSAIMIVVCTEACLCASFAR